MDTVKSFNAELSSLYDVKPPISKAKMTAITKGAIKAVKFYKHVVQSVEKFLQKCRPEYKIPGLYVIDSIVRQSRHQFGTDKDVFAPRFSKNINFTFYFIYQCTNEEKSKVIRVLNLWQRNSVFPPEVIQPLFDMADSNHPKFKEVEAQMLGAKGPASGGPSVSKSSSSAARNSQDNLGNLNGSIGRDASMGGYEDASEDSNNQSQPLIMGNLPNLSSTEMSLATRLQHLQHLFGQEPSAANAAPPPPSQAKASATSNNPDTGQIRFNKKLLDFDYDDEDDEPNQQQQQAAEKTREAAQQQEKINQPAAVDTLGNLLTNPDILRHLQSLQQQISAPAVGLPAMLNSGMMGGQPPPPSMDNNGSASGEVKSGDPMHHAALAPFGGVDFSQPPPGFTPLAMRLPHMALGAPMGLHGLPPAVAGLPPPHAGSVGFPPAPPLPPQQPPPSADGRREDFYPPNNNNGDTNDVEHNRNRDRDRRRSRSRSGSRNRGSGRGRHRKSRSRSRSRDRDRRSRRTSRSRSRSRSPGRNRRRRSRSKEREDREKERLEREKERDRKRKGLPTLRKEHLSVCSTTLWVGHLSKLVQQEELSDTFGQYGEIVSIDLIPPRGCAFVCMHRRQDAYRALNKLAGHKLQGKAITVAWAPGKGVKAKEWKDYWEVEQGVSYIPWSKLSSLIDFDSLEEGGSFDDESLPAWMRNNENHAADGGSVAMQLVAAAPGFIPIPEAVNPGPPTPETAPDSQNLPASVAAVAAAAAGAAGAINAVSSAGLTTTLPPNLPTYAMAPLGLLPGTGLVPAMPLGAMRLAGPPPGLLVPPHHPAGANMPNLIGQPILAGLVPQIGLQGPQPPAGFFGVFPPAPAGNNNVQNNEDDMELEEADEDVHKETGHHHSHHPHHTPHKGQDMDDQRHWDGDGDGSDREQPPHGPRHGAKASAPGAPGAPSSGLLERLRSLANCDGPPPPPPPPGFRPHFEADSQHVNGEDRRPPAGSIMVRTDLGGLNLASALRGAPLTTGAGVQELGVRPAAPFGARSSAAGLEPFSPTHRHLPGTQHGGAPPPFVNAVGNFTSLRGPPPGLNASPGPRMGLASNRGMMFEGRGRGFRALDGVDGDRRPSHWPEEEMRGGWRDRGDEERFRTEGHADWSVEGREFGDRGAERHWRSNAERGEDRDRRGGGGGGRDWGNRRPPRGDRDRGGGGRDRFGRDRDSRGGLERRGRSGERERERDNRNSRDRRGGGRWSHRRSPSREKAADSSAEAPSRDAESVDPAELSHHQPKSPPPPPEECDVTESSAPPSDHRPPEPPPMAESADEHPPEENDPPPPNPPHSPPDGAEGTE